MPAYRCLQSTLVSFAGAAGVTLMLVMPVRVVGAQARPAAPPVSPNSPSARKSSVSRSPNVRMGQIASLDPAAELLDLKERSGAHSTYVITEKTRYFRNRRAGQRADFKIGDFVVLRFRRSRSESALLLTELDDPASWTFLSDLRKSTTRAVVRELSDAVLAVEVGPDRIPMEYTVSDKTRWERAGKEIDAGAFKPGEQVYVVPRSLPSGAIMARAVSDSMEGAAQEKERSATSVHGTILSVEMAARRFVLKTLAGDTRTFAFTDKTEVSLAGKLQPIGSLRNGLHVAARLRRDISGSEVVWRVTIESTRRVSSSKRAVPTDKGVTPGH